LPYHRRVSFDALYVTAEEDALVGGDWYDAFLLPSGNIAISVGDVAGHGVDAAVAAERVRQAIFAAAADSEDPAAILIKADKTLTLQQANAVATAAVAIVDPQHHEMRYATAGHPPPVVAAPSAPAQRLAPGGIPLGIARPIQPVGDEPQTRTVALAPQSLIVFYTDGLVEFKRDAAAAEAQLLEHLNALAADAAQPHPATALRQAVMGDAPPRDDTVLLTLRLLPEM
jgi:serine phosphatase RsbU (regulator of sigma subunit)